MKKVIVTLFLLSSSVVLGEDIRDQQQQLFNDIKHLKVDFQQTIYKKLRNRQLKRSGTAYFSKPNLFRWNFDSAQMGVEEFYYNGNTLTHFREQERLVTHYKANVGLARELNEVVNLVLDPEALYLRYDQVESEKVGKETQLTLKPRLASANDVGQLVIRVSPEQKFITMIKITYVDGNYTQFQFENPSYKANSLNIFSFSKKGDFTVRSHG